MTTNIILLHKNFGSVPTDSLNPADPVTNNTNVILRH